MLFNGRTLIFTFSRTQVRIAEHEHLQSLFKTSMVSRHTVFDLISEHTLINGHPPFCAGGARRDLCVLAVLFILCCIMQSIIDAN